MRAVLLKSGLAFGLLLGGLAVASAAPLAGTAPRPDNLVRQVQLECNNLRCLDPRTGAYTQSTCNARGCRPSSGIVGYDRSQIRGGRGSGGWNDRPHLPQPGFRGPQVDPRRFGHDGRRWDNDPPPRRRYDDRRRRGWDD